MARILLALALIVVALAFGCESLVATSPRPGSPSSMPEPSGSLGPVQLIDMTTQPGLEDLRLQSGVEVGYNITAGAIDADHDGILDDPDKFVRIFKRRVPQGFTGVVSLDWEKPIIEWLNESPTSPNYRRAIENLTELLLIAKRERPQAKIGYYGFPMRQYWKRDSGWRARAMGMTELFERADWIGPSLYLMYKSPEERPVAESNGYLVENIRLAIDVAAASGDKPVYVWVTHRYHPSNKRHGQQLVAPEEFERTLRTILTVNHRGRSVDGVIWWGADQWYHKRNRIPDAMSTDADSHFRTVHREYMQRMTNVVSTTR